MLSELSEKYGVLDLDDLVIMHETKRVVGDINQSKLRVSNLPSYMTTNGIPSNSRNPDMIFFKHLISLKA